MFKIFPRCQQRPRKHGREARIARLTLKLTHKPVSLLACFSSRNRQWEKGAKSYLNAFCNNAILDVCSSHHPLCFMWLNNFGRLNNESSVNQFTAEWFPPDMFHVWIHGQNVSFYCECCRRTHVISSQKNNPCCTTAEHIKLTTLIVLIAHH